MRRVVRDEQAKRLRGADAVEPAQRLIHDDGAGVAFDTADGLAVAHEVLGIVLRRRSPGPSGEPVVEAVVARLGLRVVRAQDAVEVPLAGQAGVVAGVLQKPGEGDFFTAQVHGAGLHGHPVEDAGAVGHASGEKAGARR